mmetsp:Transcript_52905/g.141380  ORF Transcript_52905/g.141380 Transcript_52905/m.141380 type:complete len:102 (+) Transcript_52905:266-571(+)
MRRNQTRKHATQEILHFSVSSLKCVAEQKRHTQSAIVENGENCIFSDGEGWGGLGRRQPTTSCWSGAHAAFGVRSTEGSAINSGKQTSNLSRQLERAFPHS